MWKKEDELKQLKSELAALDRKIQLELAPPTPEVTEKDKERQEVKPEAESVRNGIRQYPEETSPQIRSPAENFSTDHVAIKPSSFHLNNDPEKHKGLKL